MADVTSAYSSGAPDFSPSNCLLVLEGFVLFNVDKLHVFMFLVLCCDVRYDLNLLCTGFMLYLCFCIGVKHDVHVRWCSCRLTVTWRVSLVEQELLTLSGHMSSPPVFNGVCVSRSFVLCVVLCRLLFVKLSSFFWPFWYLSYNGTWLPLWYLQTFFNLLGRYKMNIPSSCMTRIKWTFHQAAWLV